MRVIITLILRFLKHIFLGIVFYYFQHEPDIFVIKENIFQCSANNAFRRKLPVRSHNNYGECWRHSALLSLERTKQQSTFIILCNWHIIIWNIYTYNKIVKNIHYITVWKKYVYMHYWKTTGKSKILLEI